jgi:multiple antibiotic resistance protein
VNVGTFIESVLLMLVLFNPFLMSAYLHEIMKDLSASQFFAVLMRAFLISGCVFVLFAVAGDRVFSQVLQVRFAAFLLFGGIVFLVIAVRYMVTGAQFVGELRGTPEHIAGSIAMPFMIGPGTVSASVLIGSRLPAAFAATAIGIALVSSCVLLMAIKMLFNAVKSRNDAIVERYVEITGRIAAIIIGTIAVEMILRGIDLWLIERG